jgi:hypothetical protein
MIEAKTFRTFIRIHSLFKGERLSANIKLTLHKALIRSVLTYAIIYAYACPARGFAADTHVLKLQRLQNRVLRSIGNFPRRTSVRELHKAFSIPFVYDYMTKLSRQKSLKIMKMQMFAIRGLNLAAVKHTTVQVTRLPL